MGLQRLHESFMIMNFVCFISINRRYAIARVDSSENQPVYSETTELAIPKLHIFSI